MASDEAESAVRNYLTALKNPGALRDDERIAKLQQRLDETSDEVERLHLRQQLREAQTPPVERYENEFITHAQAWAEEQGLTPDVFAEEGVSDDVLRRAGFRRGRERRARTTRRPRGRTRVSADEVRAAIQSRDSFTIKSLEQQTGASVGMIRNVVNEEEEAGRVVREGTDPDHVGPGRAPTLYRRV